MWSSPIDVTHCRTLSIDKTEWWPEIFKHCLHWSCRLARPKTHTLIYIYYYYSFNVRYFRAYAGQTFSQWCHTSTSLGPLPSLASAPYPSYPHPNVLSIMFTDQWMMQSCHVCSHCSMFMMVDVSTCFKLNLYHNLCIQFHYFDHEDCSCKSQEK